MFMRVCFKTKEEWGKDTNFVKARVCRLVSQWKRNESRVGQFPTACNHIKFSIFEKKKFFLPLLPFLGQQGCYCVLRVQDRVDSEEKREYIYESWKLCIKQSFMAHHRPHWTHNFTSIKYMQAYILIKSLCIYVMFLLLFLLLFSFDMTLCRYVQIDRHICIIIKSFMKGIWQEHLHFQVFKVDLND